MYQTFFTVLLDTMQSAAAGLAQMISGIIIALAFLVGVGKSLYALFESRSGGGVEAFQATARHQAGVFLIIVAVTFPLPGLPGGIVGSFPAVMIKSGFVTAEKFTSHLPAEFQLPFDKLGQGVDAKIKKTDTRPMQGFSEGFEKKYMEIVVQDRNVTEKMHEAMSWSGQICRFILQFFIAAAWALAMWGLFFWCPAAALSLSIAGWFAAGLFATWILFPGLQISADPLIQIVTYATDYVLRWACDFIFYTLIYFTFVAMMISYCIRSVLFCITAPLSLVTVPFDSKRRVFVDVLWRAIAMALVPVMIAVTLSLVTYAYSTLISSGMLNKIRDGYLAGGFTTEMFLSWKFLEHFCEYILRLVVYIIALPFVVAMVGVKILRSVPKLIEEILGVGIGELAGNVPGASMLAHAGMMAAMRFIPARGAGAAPKS